RHQLQGEHHVGKGTGHDDAFFLNVCLFFFKQKTAYDIWDWTQGFFPGGLWYIYEYTQNPEWKAAAEKWTEALEEAKFLTQHHDIGFVMYCSYGNAIRLETDTAKINRYNQILIQSAESALTRYYDNV